MDQFLIFYAPFILIIAAIAIAFWVARERSFRLEN